MKRTRSQVGRWARRKGKRGEREIAELVRRILYPDGRGTVLRTPMSGAWHGTTVMTGDLACVLLGKGGEPDIADEAVPYFFEVKRIKELPVDRMLAGHFGSAVDWMAKAKSFSRDKIPLILWRMDRSPWFVLMSYPDFTVQQEWYGPLPNGYTALINRFSSADDREYGFVNLTVSVFAQWYRRLGR